MSRREAEVLEALGEHLTNAEIAARLHVSVRTIEGHVSALLRKLGADDRWALAEVADEIASSRPSAASLPVPLTTFVGRAAEQGALAEALRGERLVTAVGLGGVGKTRLAIAVAHDAVDRHPDGVWYVDLAPATRGTMIAPAVASVLRLGGTGASAPEDAVVAALAAREALVVLDNCEHLGGSLAVFVENLLGRCERLSVLAVSRVRMGVPFERVFPVPGLSLPDESRAGEAGVDSDALALFKARAEAAGRPVTRPEEEIRVSDLCRALDGNALAIELAAARLPTLGVDGLEAGLGDRLRLLAGGSRHHERHSSLRASLDFSYELAGPIDQAVLRRLAVIAAPFGVDLIAAIAGFAPIPEGEEAEVVIDVVGRLAEQSLVIPLLGAERTSYHLLETVRQYGLARLREADEENEVRERHLSWCCRTATSLASEDMDDDGRRSFDTVADDLRAALEWATEQPAHRHQACDLAGSLADLAFGRGIAEEAQRCFEQAAALADGRAVVTALQRAAGAAICRESGDDAFRLYKETAAAAMRMGDDADAARSFALAAALVNRMPAIFAQSPSPEDVEALLARARALGTGDPSAEQAVLVAEAFRQWASGPADDGPARRAIAQGQGSGDPLLQSAALDALTVAQLTAGELRNAAASTRRRIQLLAPLGASADAAAEVNDANHMAIQTHIALGDLTSARRFAAAPLQHAAFRDNHLDALRLALPDALAGRWRQALVAAHRFRVGWERQGRPVILALLPGVEAAAMVHGLRGDEEAHESWRAVIARLSSRAEGYYISSDVCAAVFDLLVLLHRGQLDQARDRITVDPAAPLPGFGGTWRPWYAALWAETAALGRHPQADSRLERARDIAAPNFVARALVARADAWMRDDRETLIAVAKDLGAAGCRYQAARTLALADGQERAEGERILTGIGAAPMARI